MEWQQCCKRIASIIFSIDSIDSTGHLCGKLTPLALCNNQSVHSIALIMVRNLTLKVWREALYFSL